MNREITVVRAAVAGRKVGPSHVDTKKATVPTSRIIVTIVTAKVEQLIPD
jgi:hypothetical protein